MMGFGHHLVAVVVGIFLENGSRSKFERRRAVSCVGLGWGKELLFNYGNYAKILIEIIRISEIPVMLF